LTAQLGALLWVREQRSSEDKTEYGSKAPAGAASLPYDHDEAGSTMGQSPTQRGVGSFAADEAEPKAPCALRLNQRQALIFSSVPFSTKSSS
jgi:hypothetical protein